MQRDCIPSIAIREIKNESMSTPSAGGNKAAQCPCLRFHKTIDHSFSLPTFPDYHLFVCPMDSPARAKRWLLFLDRKLVEFRDAASNLSNENNLISFPLTFPYDRFCAMDKAAALARTHNEICHLTREACMTPRGSLREEKTTRAREAIARQIQVIEKLEPQTQQCDLAKVDSSLSSILPQIRGIHAHCLEEFETFLRELLDHGISQPWRVERTGDFRSCPLGHLLHSDEPEALGACDHVPEMKKLQMEHRLFHEATFVVANEAQALRLRPLCREELPGVEARLHQLLSARRLALQSLGRLIPTAIIQTGDRRGGACRFSMQNNNQTLPLSMLLEDLVQWKDKVVSLTTGIRFTGVEKSLPPSSTLLGQRLTATMENHALWRTHAPVLQRLYTSNVRMHGLAIRLFTLARANHLDEALSLVPPLERAYEEATQLTKSLADLLHLDGKSVAA